MLLASFAVNAQTVKLKSSEGFIQTNDSVRLFYRLLGEGKDTIIVFHGGGFGSSYLATDLTPLAAHHTLLFLDLPLHCVVRAVIPQKIQVTLILKIKRCWQLPQRFFLLSVQLVLH